MLTLGIESTCDETACAIVKNGKEILSNVVSSQIDLHAEYGGVVPELACRRHVDVMIPVIKEALKLANVSLQEIDLIAVAHGPGLIGALLIGLNAAKGLSIALEKPFIGVNHIEAHLYAAIMSQDQEPSFPCLGVILSGGHTALVIMHSLDKFTLISQTVDDAIGEAFDKVAKLLGLPYPGGPQIEKLAENGDPRKYPFKGGRLKNDPLGFSFSGLKTAVLYTIKGQNNRLEGDTPSHKEMRDIAASFQSAAFEDLIKKTLLAAHQYGLTEVVFGGGVTNNRYLRTLFTKLAPSLKLHWPTFELSLDNAAMIAGLGYHRYLANGCGDSLELEALTRIAFM
ncbi:MAG: tRNA (adenosine(37)-N6)-threonylcarbamoyltransferase complex transferase subunit TsaD [Parachlamydiaceae bacterium]|nr:tRNA (adenosine(37)-N6)-threonylcarbamoyltransferase complex transferase subunit TsaD [Parachlamydiaceae bacterium]